MSHSITFTTLIHIEYRKTITIFKYFKEIYRYDLKHDFQIITLHVDGEFAPHQALIHEMQGGGQSQPSK